jgi:hypothetical protein
MLRWARKVRLAGEDRNDYASRSDFCAVFIQQLDSLYTLALILTGDEPKAEQCLFAALDLCVEGSLVFKESAAAWSRRSVIKIAVKSMSPTPFSTAVHYLPGHRSDLTSDQDVPIKCLLEMPAFERFVFVMSVLEGYSDRDCALLLDCSCADLVAARIRAFQQISRRLREMYPDYGSSVVDADWLECG